MNEQPQGRPRFRFTTTRTSTIVAVLDWSSTSKAGLTANRRAGAWRVGQSDPSRWCGADERTGDGAGILTQLPHELFAPVLTGFGAAVGPGEYGVATVFLPETSAERVAAHAIIWNPQPPKLAFLCWAGAWCLSIQMFSDGSHLKPARRSSSSSLAGQKAQDEAAFERTLMLLRKAAERHADRSWTERFLCRVLLLPDDHL